MSKADRAAEALLVGYGVIFWSLTGWDGTVALIGSAMGAVGIYLNGGWRWSAWLRMVGIYMQLLLIGGMLWDSIERPEFAAYLAIFAVGLVAFKRAARHATEYSRAASWKQSH